MLQQSNFKKLWGEEYTHLENLLTMDCDVSTAYDPNTSKQRTEDQRGNVI